MPVIANAALPHRFVTVHAPDQVTAIFYCDAHSCFAGKLDGNLGTPVGWRRDGEVELGDEMGELHLQRGVENRRLPRGRHRGRSSGFRRGGQGFSGGYHVSSRSHAEKGLQPSSPPACRPIRGRHLRRSRLFFFLLPATPNWPNSTRHAVSCFLATASWGATFTPPFVMRKEKCMLLTCTRLLHSTSHGMMCNRGWQGGGPF